MLGTALQRVLGERDAQVVAPVERDFDITSEKVVTDVVSRFAAGGPGVVVNAAAYTDVERAEDDPVRAFLVNETGPALLAAAAASANLGFVHVSTDFVFDGTKDGAYVEDDDPNPLSVYGASKLAGERAVAVVMPQALTVRSEWAFGPGGRNFPGKILELAQTRDTLKVVTDEVGSPTYTIDLAAGIVALVDAGARGLYHLAGSGVCTRYELAAEVLRLSGLERELIGVTADEFPTRAARPRNSRLDCSKAAAAGVVLPHWKDALARHLAGE